MMQRPIINQARVNQARVNHPGLSWLGGVAALVVLSADQASKWWVLHGLDLPAVGQIVLLPVLNLTMVWNRGVTFGLLTGFGAAGTWLLTAAALLIVAALAVWLTRAESRLVAAALGAIAGGAVGNVIDRLRFGAVVDFIHAHVGDVSWYVFNIADAAIVCGVTALVLDGMRRRPARGAAPGVAIPSELSDRN